MNHRLLVGVLLLGLACSSSGSSTSDGSGAAGASGGTGGTGGASGGTGGTGGASGGSSGGAGAAGTSGGSSGAGTGGRGGGGGAAGSGGARADGGGDDGPSCPTSVPMGAACTGAMICTYGQSVCCGVVHTLYSCTCTGGSFLCLMSNECNIVCPDAGRDGTSG